MSYFVENSNCSRKLSRQFNNMVLPAKVVIQQDTHKFYTVFSLYLFLTQSKNNWLRQFDTRRVENYKVCLINITGQVRSKNKLRSNERT